MAVLDIPLGTGPFRGRDALAWGFTPAQIRAHVRRDRWLVLRRDVLVTAADRSAAACRPDTLHAQDVRALMLALHRGTVAAAGVSAARIYGLEFLDPPAPGLVVCTSDAGVSGTHKRDYFLRSAPLPEHHLQFRHGVLITSPARTLLDLASAMEFTPALVLAESAIRKNLVRPEELAAIVAAAENRPGIERARDTLLFARPGAGSVLESTSSASLRIGGIPEHERQWEFVINGRTYLVDCHWGHCGVPVVGEGDGTEKYLSGNRMETVRKIREEKEREQALRDLGAEVVRWGMKEARDPVALAARVNAAFSRASARARGQAS